MKIFRLARTSRIRFIDAWYDFETDSHRRQTHDPNTPYVRVRFKYSPWILVALAALPGLFAISFVFYIRPHETPIWLLVVLPFAAVPIATAVILWLDWQHAHKLGVTWTEALHQRLDRWYQTVSKRHSRPARKIRVRNFIFQSLLTSLALGCLIAEKLYGLPPTFSLRPHQIEFFHMIGWAMVLMWPIELADLFVFED